MEFFFKMLLLALAIISTESKESMIPDANEVRQQWDFWQIDLE